MPHSVGPPGGSLTSLVQQREQQTARKMEALSARNDELTEICARLDSERREVASKLAELEHRLAASEEAHAARESQASGRLAALDSRMAYLEQGAEERFVLVEKAVAAALPRDSLRDFETSLLAGVDSRIASLKETVTARCDGITASAQLLAVFVGGEELAGSLKRQQLPPSVDPLSKRCDEMGVTCRGLADSLRAELSARCDGLSDAIRAERDRVEQLIRDARSKASDQDRAAQQLRDLSERVSGQGPRIDAADSRACEAEEAVRAMEQELRQHRDDASSNDARVTAAEGRLRQLESGVVEAAQTASAAQSSLEEADGRLGRVEAFGGRIADVECAARAASTRLEHLEERVDGVLRTGLQHEEQTRKLSLDLQRHADEQAALEEQRKQRDGDESVRRMRAEEHQRRETEGLRRDVDELKTQVGEAMRSVNALRDSAPLVDEARIATLCAELDRGKEVLDGITAMHDLRLRDRTVEMEGRMTALERAVHTSQRFGSRSAHSATPAPASRAAHAAASSPPRRALTPTPVAPPPSVAGAGLRGASHSPGHSHSVSPRRAGVSPACASLPSYPGRGPAGVSVSPGALAAVLDRSGSACSALSQHSMLSARLAPPPPPPPPPQPPMSFSASLSPPAISVPHRRVVSGSPESSQPEVSPASVDRERGRQQMMSTLREQLRGYESILSGADADARSATPTRSSPRGQAVGEQRRAAEEELVRVNKQLSFIQLAFQALSEKEEALGESKAVFMEQLKGDSSERADALKGKMARLVEDIRRSKHNVYERERGLVDQANRLRAELAALRVQERQMSAADV